MSASHVIFALALIGGSTLAGPITPVLEKVPCAVADRQDFQVPDRVLISGWLGSRIEASMRNRLLILDPARLLEGYKKRPGREGSDGEFVGKWLHAATLAWVNTQDPVLREKLDLVAHELCQCQLPDGYLGTYLEKDRWTAWDVWSHKYNLLGLIAHVRYTGNEESLETCRRMGDLLCLTFGDGPGQRDIVKDGIHVGMAPTSVLEPMVLLYRLTGKQRYLDFCNYILRAWEQPDGPHILSTLSNVKRVDKVANGKAYEMLSCLNGALELYRTTGDRQLLDAVLIAWQDIVDKRLYLTGAASYRERFHDDHDLPNDLNVGEVCATVSWMQLNAQLLRLTGEARFAEQLELTTLNQLLGAQRPDGTGWCMYAPLSGQKAFNDSKDALTCCTASGPRGVALIPTFAVTTMADGIAVNIYASCKAALTLPDGHQVSVTLDTKYPADGLVQLILHSTTPHEFAVRLRIPAWCQDARLAVNDQPLTTPVRAGKYATIQRSWRDGDVITLQMPLAPRLIVGEHYENWNRLALAYGPMVLAADDRLNPTIKVGQFRVPTTDLTKLDFKEEQPGQVYSIEAMKIDTGEPVTVRLAPFAEAGSSRETYQVWMERFQF
jgi:DUF1680 family protein